MPTQSPLQTQHHQYAAKLRADIEQQIAEQNIAGSAAFLPEVEWLPYGQTGDETTDADGERDITHIVTTFGPVEAEYAAIRRGVALVDRAQRGMIKVTGNDRIEFLNRMLTQELKDFETGQVRQAFWLNRKGRIEADLTLIASLNDALLIDTDLAQVEHTVKSLDSFLFAEDVQIDDVSDQFHRIAMHGPKTMEVLSQLTNTDPFLLPPNAATTIQADGVDATIDIARIDTLGELGVELVIPVDVIEEIWSRVLEIDVAFFAGERRLRPIGWYASNIARIEAGTPLYNIDFGPTNLPHETGVLRERVSFTKGCYLGQEIVARMESLGRPKQMLVGLKMQDDLLPVAGAQVFEKTESGFGNQVGVITSSTLSPMLGADAIAFALVKTKHADEGNELIVNAEGKQGVAIVGPLRFWEK